MEIIGKEIIDSLVNKIIEFNDNAENKLEEVIKDYNAYIQDYLEDINLPDKIKKVKKKNEELINDAREYFKENKKMIIYNTVKDTLKYAIDIIILHNIDQKYPCNKDYHEKMIELEINRFLPIYLEKRFGEVMLKNKNKLNNEEKAILVIVNSYQNRKTLFFQKDINNLIKEKNKEIMRYALNQNEINDERIEKQRSEILSYLAGISSSLDSDLEKKWGPFKDYLKQIEKKIAPEEKTGPQPIYT